MSDSPQRFDSTGSLSWLWRPLVTVVLLASVLYAGYSGYKVLFKKEPVEATPEVVDVGRNLPDSNKKYKYEEARQLLIEGQKLMRSGNLNGSHLLERILQDHPDSPQAKRAMIILAATYRYNMRRPDKARRMYEKFLHTYPTDRLVPETIEDLRTLNKETNAPDQTQAIIRRIMPLVENDPAMKKKLEGLLVSR
ncbi:MAG TPA: hypothetical protein PKW95_10800 [bacterium]|nr:hypothetical protein [bacterium]